MSRAAVALGRTPIAEAFLDGSAKALDLEPRDISPIHRAFRPMVEEAAFGLSELAIVTAVQAVEAGRPVVPLPITIAARFQHRCLVQNANFTSLAPGDLPGKRVAVRAYSQTTGAWVRTILDTEYGVDIGSIDWVTQEAPHVSGAPEPDNVLRDPSGAGPADLLREGAVAAAIFGNDMPTDDWVTPVIENPDETARESFARTGVVQINHIVAVSRDLAQSDPDLVRAASRRFLEAKARTSIGGPDLLPFGPEAMRPSVQVLLGSLHRQGLTRRRMSFEDVFGEGAAFLA